MATPQKLTGEGSTIGGNGTYSPKPPHITLAAPLSRKDNATVAITIAIGGADINGRKTARSQTKPSKPLEKTAKTSA